MPLGKHAVEAVLEGRWVVEALSADILGRVVGQVEGVHDHVLELLAAQQEALIDMVE